MVEELTRRGHFRRYPNMRARPGHQTGSIGVFNPESALDCLCRVEAFAVVHAPARGSLLGTLGEMAGERVANPKTYSLFYRCFKRYGET
jgi:hypothetical protein